MPKVSVGTVPPEAMSKGSINATVSDAERAASRVGPETAGGPSVGAMGEYTPATYKTLRGNIRQDR